MKNKFKIILGTSIGLIILLWLISKIGFNQIFSTLRTINLNYIPLLVILSGITLFIGSVNLWLLIKPIKNIKLSKVVKYFCLSWASGIVTPGKIGEFSMIYFLKKEEISIGQSTAVILIDKIISMGSMFLFSIATLFLFFPINIAQKIIVIIFIVAFLGFIVIYTSFGRNLIKRYILRKHAIKFSQFSKTNKNYFNNYKLLLFINFLITTFRLFIMSSIGYLLFLSFGLKINFVYVFLIFNTVQILSNIPITINGLGTRELINVYLYSQIGVLPKITLAKSIMELILSYGFGILIFSSFWKKILSNKGEKNENKNKI